MKFIFIRHAKDDSNYRGGWSSLDITPEGEKQAEELAKFLFNNKTKFNIQKILASDLKRSISTANIINEKLKLPIEYIPELREMNNGVLAGMPNDEAIAKYPGLYFSSLEMEERYPEGESPLEFYNRIKKFLLQVINDYCDFDGNVAIVTHHGVINIIYHVIRNVYWNNKNKPITIKNCSIHILDIDKKEIKEIVF